MFLTQVIGNLGSDAELKDGDNGKKFAAFSVAHKELSRNQQGNPVEKVVWISVAWYGYTNKMLACLKKGTKVFVAGYIKVTAYLDKENKPQSGITIYPNTVELCGMKNISSGE